MMTTKKVREPSVYRTRIKDWSEEERPREKLELRGPKALTDAELLAILLGSGTRKITALDLARTLIEDHKHLAGLAKTGVSELRQYKGVGKVKAIKLVAAFEIARRVEAFTEQPRARIKSPEDAVQWFRPFLRDLRHEVFIVILLDGASQIIKDVKVSEGTLNASLVHPREVFKAALDERAASVILMHNHPSGNPDPSGEDLVVTRQLVEAGRIMGIPVRDHIIVAGSGYTSLATLGHL